MANISRYLAAIMSAIYGRDVRSSIHDAIYQVNKAQEEALNAGTAINDGDAATGIYAGSLYINTTTNELLQADGTTWVAIDNIEGNAITSITGPDPDPTDVLADVYTINFSKIPSQTYKVHNAKSIVQITGPVVDPLTPLIDKYTIEFNDGTTQDYEVGNGKGIVSILKTAVSADGLTDTYTITYNDGSTQTYDVKNAKSIVSIAKIATSGLVDTYKITYNDGTDQNYDVVNGKDGNTVLRGTEVNGNAVAATGFTLTTDCQTGDTYINSQLGYVYECTQGAPAGIQSLWKYSFAMTGGGGAQYLWDLTDVNRATMQSPQDGQIMKFDASPGVNQWVATYGGSGHDLKPTPGSGVSEQDVVNYVKSMENVPTNNEVMSVFGIANWSNVKRIRVVYNGTIGHTGIGTWKDGPVVAADESDWWENAAFKLLDTMAPNVDGYDVDWAIKYDPGNGEVASLGGYIIDTTTGKMCIRFANYLVDPSTAKIAVDITFTRTDVG